MRRDDRIIGLLRVGATGRDSETCGVKWARKQRERTMPQAHPRTENLRTEHFRSEAAPSEPTHRDKPATIDTALGEVGARNVNAGLRMQKQMFEVFEDISRDWLARTASKAELALKLPNKLRGASSVPDVFSAYQEWFGEWMNVLSEDNRRLISDGQRIADASARCFAETSPLGKS
jgi:hypothetical protein